MNQVATILSHTLCVQGQFGALVSKKPAKWIGREWEMDIQFHIHGKGHQLFGDGFAIWYTQDRVRRGNGEQ